MVSMLDLSRIDHFRYFAREMFESSDMDPRVWNPLLASLIAKASTAGIPDARIYIKEQEADNIITGEMAQNLYRLLDRNKRWR